MIGDQGQQFRRQLSELCSGVIGKDDGVVHCRYTPSFARTSSQRANCDPEKY
jgi:hypothetical protein